MNLTALVLAVSLLLSLCSHGGEARKNRSSLFPYQQMKFTFKDESLEYDYYRYSCPEAEEIVRSAMQRLHKIQPDATPALLRLVFHDCFIQGCDASVLLESMDGSMSEKEAPPNETLKGFDLIEIIKSELEEACPGTVSCADILVLAAREGLVLAGGPYYPLHTGRRDSILSFPEVAIRELPSPIDDLSRTLTLFASRGFDERETVSLLGGHSVGNIHCQFFRNRLYNYAGTGRPDPSIDTGFLFLMRLKCNNSGGLSNGDGPDMKMDYEGETGPEFGKHYYNSLMHRRGILSADQQLMASEGTSSWVQAYALDGPRFQRDFAQVMMKLSNLQVLTRPLGQVRRNCSMVAPEG